MCEQSWYALLVFSERHHALAVPRPPPKLLLSVKQLILNREWLTQEDVGKVRGGDCFFVQAELGKMIYSDICLFLQGTKITSLTADIDVVEKKPSSASVSLNCKVAMTSPTSYKDWSLCALSCFDSWEVGGTQSSFQGCSLGTGKCSQWGIIIITFSQLWLNIQFNQSSVETHLLGLSFYKVLRTLNFWVHRLALEARLRVW